MWLNKVSKTQAKHYTCMLHTDLRAAILCAHSFIATRKFIKQFKPSCFRYVQLNTKNNEISAFLIQLSQQCVVLVSRVTFIDYNYS